MDKEQLIKIAKAGFPYHIQKKIDFDNCEMYRTSEIYRLYDKDSKFNFILPKESILSIFVGVDKFIQFTSYNRAFNHYAAIKEMEKLGLIKNK